MNPNNEILFKETQRFKLWWLWVILLSINALFLYGLFQQVIRGQPFGDKPMSNTGLVISTVLTFLLTFMFFNFRLDTIIKKDGIYVRFSPLHLKFKHYSWETLNKSYIRNYSAILEYGGWGLRSGSMGTAFNVSGNEGLQLEFTNNKKMLIGTKKPGEITAVLQQLGQLKH